ncbi:alpha/beta hydrolase domain-containing protein [Pseudonocardia sp.]|uniref:alpha/beta hydrolase domain-containing protein n=1 Tax=Pseudonocardia sp. TaxID=60912 RepID=UPI002624D85C|nr:alpha/beta hydrolase domain-containing protein [Pseudonocardia sp.]
MSAGGVQARTPSPGATVEGPVPVTAESRPFMVRRGDLDAAGFVVEEYFLAGTANVYDWGPEGTSESPVVRTPAAPYRTRMLIRRPVDPTRFSGNVWVELSNPSRAHDIELQWCAATDKFLRDGDVHVALTIKPIAVAALQRFDPVRYASLSMANPLPPQEQTVGSLPGEPGYDENLSKLSENGLAWDIISQVGLLMRSGDHAGSLRGYDVRHVFATGVSQTGFFLNTWTANFSGPAAAAAGGPVYDGVVAFIGAGKTVPINQALAATGPDDPRSALPAGHVPFIRADSQSEPFTLDGYRTRRPDSDDPADPYRLYEYAGTSHGWSDIYNHQAPLADVLAAGAAPLTFATCAEHTWNSLPRQYLEPAVLANMERWVADGLAPPRQAEPLRILEPGTPRARFETDEHGNVLGGVRTPYVDVPTRTYHDRATDSSPRDLGRFFGHEVRFGSAVLEQLYGGHADYVARVDAAVAEMLAQRWVEPAEAEHIRAHARYTAIP